MRWLNHAVAKIWPICMEEIASQQFLMPIIPWFLDKFKPWTAVWQFPLNSLIIFLRFCFTGVLKVDLIFFVSLWVAGCQHNSDYIYIYKAYKHITVMLTSMCYSS